MGGQQGSRGYLYQGIVSILSSCNENNWNQISVEYTTTNDKVDIALLSDTDNVLKAVQVKSSINLFKKEDIVNWLTDIMNDVSAEEYQLILIGNCQEQANKLIKSIEKLSSNTLDEEAKRCLGTFGKKIDGKNVTVLLLPFDEDHLMGVIRDSLNRFIFCKGYSIDFASLEEICYALLSLHMFLGTKGKVIRKSDYEKRITDWIISSSNGSMKKNGNHSELKINIFSQSDESFSEDSISIAAVQGPDGKLQTWQSSDQWSQTAMNHNMTDAQVDRWTAIVNFLVSDDGYNFRNFGIQDIDWKYAADGSVECLWPKDADGNQVNPYRYGTWPWARSVGATDGFALVNPAYPQWIKDLVIRQSERYSAPDVNLIPLDSEFAFFTTEAYDAAVAGLEDEVYTKITELMTSKNIEADWNAWVNQKSGEIQPALDELNANLK